ncbi:unnamed protein product [Larinioides sclopetarius]|uniref:Transposase n=1 Tax=Larinioides sclopetarius TaxID=280406 RepID=A0AAV2A236_9ARAC
MCLNSSDYTHHINRIYLRMLENGSKLSKLKKVRNSKINKPKIVHKRKKQLSFSLI